MENGPGDDRQVAAEALPECVLDISATRVAYDTSLRPETCQSPVIPGLALRTIGMYWPYRRISSSVMGRGPTRLISPLSTLINWGNSSSDVRRKHPPSRVTRGSSFSLKVRGEFPRQHRVRGQHGGEAHIGVLDHRAQLQTLDRATAAADVIVTVKRTALGRQPNQAGEAHTSGSPQRGRDTTVHIEGTFDAIAGRPRNHRDVGGGVSRTGYPTRPIERRARSSMVRRSMTTSPVVASTVMTPGSSSASSRSRRGTQGRISAARHRDHGPGVGVHAQ